MALVWADEPTDRKEIFQKPKEQEKRDVPSAVQSQEASLRFKQKTISYLSVRDRKAQKQQGNKNFPKKGRSAVGNTWVYF
ncbi:hypothetical protein JNUCC42_12235 [Brevibacterium sp. JNUCC-42]|nr:hypothetical protein JNUCC42_12235 [Brevibacterium sp. JNUCC-42]